MSMLAYYVFLPSNVKSNFGLRCGKNKLTPLLSSLVSLIAPGDLTTSLFINVLARGCTESKFRLGTLPPLIPTLEGAFESMFSLAGMSSSLFGAAAPVPPTWNDYELKKLLLTGTTVFSGEKLVVARVARL